jgi:tyrosine-protein kinase Etk/Wzc
MQQSISCKPGAHNEALIVKQIFLKWLQYWPLFLGSLLLAMSITYFMNRFSLPVYEVSTSLLVQDDRSNDISQQLIGLNGFGDFGQKTRNEIAVLKSYDLAREAVLKTDYEISFFRDNRFFKKEIMPPSGITIKFDRDHFQPLNVLFSVEAANDSLFHISGHDEKLFLYKYSDETIKASDDIFLVDTTVVFGQWIEIPQARFRIDVVSEVGFSKEFSFSFNSLKSQVEKWARFHVSPLEGTSVLEISVRTPLKEKGTGFLNALTYVFLRRGISRQQEIARRTIDFIDRQLFELKDSLHHSAENMQSVRAEKGVLDIDYEFERLKFDLEHIEEKAAKSEIEKRYLFYLKEQLEKKEKVSDIIIPASLEIDNQQLQEMLSELYAMTRETKEVENMTLRDTPFLKRREERLSQMKTVLLEAVDALINDNQYKKDQVETRRQLLQKKMWKMPVNREFFSQLEKNYKINDALYTMLLTRRSEMEILLASNIPANEVLEKPRPDRARIILPDEDRNYERAAAIGLILPALILGFYFYFNDKIQSDDQLEQISDYQTIGHILMNRHQEYEVVRNHPNSLVAESFRSLRTNLQFIETYDHKESGQVFVVSSGNIGEGKSFISLNLALSLAIINYRVALLSFDLRRPKISEYLGEKDNGIGISSYLAGHCRMEDIMQTGPVKNLLVGRAGMVPPNPPELMMRKGLVSKLFNWLRREFDFVVVDSPPIGRVSDSLLLKSYVDHWLFIVRHNHSRIRNTERVLRDLKYREVNNVSLIVNGIKAGKNRLGYGAYNSYGYGYGYGYDAK